MVRSLYYKYPNYFSKDSYGNQTYAILDFVSQNCRVKYGDEWVCIPHRAFLIVSETKGKYDGDLRQVFLRKGRRWRLMTVEVVFCR